MSLMHHRVLLFNLIRDYCVRFDIRTDLIEDYSLPSELAYTI